MSAEASNNIPHSITESQFSAVMPYKEDSGQTSSNVFSETSITDPHTSQQISQSLDTSEASSVNGTPPQSPVPRRSTRSTRGAPPVCILEGLLPIVPEFPTCLTTPYIDKLCLYQVYQIYFWFNLVNMYSLVATIKSNCINCSYVQYAAMIAVFLLYMDRDQSVYDW